MKKIILFTAILVSAIAADAQVISERVNYHCSEIVEDGQKYLTVDLYDIDGKGVREGKKAKYSIEVLENDGISDGSNVYSGNAIATQSDVQVWFKAKGVTVGLYLDEDDQNWIEIDGKTHTLRCDAEVEE